MTSKAKHAQRSKRGYKEHQQMARTFLTHCTVKNTVKQAQQTARKEGLISRLFRRRTDNHE